MTMQDKAQVRRDLERLVGKTIRSVRRVFYTFGEIVQRNEGPLQLEFGDGSVILFQSGSNGQDLVVELEQWRDPFAGKLTPENRTYIEQYGKWSLFDVSDEDPYAGLCGNRVLHVQAIDLQEQSEAEGFPIDEAVAKGWDIDFGTVVGVLLSVDGLVIRAESIMDELRVDVRPGTA